MFANPAALAGFDSRNSSARRLMRRMAAAVIAAEERARQRRDYERLMECDDILRDVGVTRDEVRRAMEMGWS